MIEEIVWIINPIKHRKRLRINAELNYESNKKAHEDNGFFFIDTLVESNIPDDLWICDLCNASIDADNRIPVADNLALCNECFAKWNTKEYIGDKTLEGNCPDVCCEMKEEE